jgi:hypothetical protein
MKGNAVNTIDFMEIYFQRAMMINREEFSDMFNARDTFNVVGYYLAMHALVKGCFYAESIKVKHSLFAACVFKSVSACSLTGMCCFNMLMEDSEICAVTGFEARELNMDIVTHIGFGDNLDML